MKFKFTKRFIILVIILWRIFAVRNNHPLQVVKTCSNILKYKQYFSKVGKQKKQQRQIKHHENRRYASNYLIYDLFNQSP